MPGMLPTEKGSSMRILRYRGNTYSSPEPVAEAPRPGKRSYRWVKYAIPSNNVLPLKQTEAPLINHQLAA
jgi:hypothetical protein